MSRFIILVFTLTALLSACGSGRQAADAKTGSGVKAGGDDVLILFFDPSQLSRDELERQAKAYGATVVYSYKNFNGMALRLSCGKNADEGIRHFSSIKGVLSVAKDRKMQLYR